MERREPGLSPATGAVAASIAPWSARTALVLASLALASCDVCGESLCSDYLAWDSDLSAEQYAEARTGAVRVCIDDDCVSGELSSLPETPPDRDLGGVPLGVFLREPAAPGEDDSTVWVGAWAEGGVPHVSASWARPMGTAVDGEAFSVEIVAADGTTIVGFAETTVTYERPGGCAPCATASLEGSTL